MRSNVTSGRALRGGRRALQALLLASALLATSAAHADADADERGRALFEQGIEAARAGRWQEALDTFTRAHEALPRPAILMNVAGAQVQTGRVVAGVASYKRALASGALSEEQRTAATRALGAAEATLAHVRVDVDAATPKDEILVDEERVARGADVPLDPGRHRLRLVRPDTKPHEETFTLAAGERRELHVSGAPLATTAPAAAAPTAAIVFAGVSVVALGTSAFLGLTGLTELSDLRMLCGAGSTCAPDDVDAARTKIVAADILLAVGLVTAAVAGYLFLTHTRRAEPVRSSVSPLLVRW